eukprot:1146302-Pelagomonas_calceolata.AAC.3
MQPHASKGQGFLFSLLEEANGNVEGAGQPPREACMGKKQGKPAPERVDGLLEELIDPTATAPRGIQRQVKGARELAAAVAQATRGRGRGWEG